ncbi:hypothetical protein [Spirosoma endbachense]|uniref:Uncharacterized protein n=1 Tax=Spirosoma endbachense TaxID=2666025 RepID=A0A6P1W0L9_9BACT|nr:hypothetical protein [Spirosoma endbachense]QHV97577.1 hypothetical protein GJR95_22335 [Spirosoma endbachense]
MKISLLESGIDSLKKGFANIISYENLLFKNPNDNNRFFLLKDAILFIQHGIEILLKDVLIKHSEYLVFKEIDITVKKAYKEMQAKNLSSVFETSLKKKIHTVTFSEAIERIKMISKYNLDDNLENKFREIETYRNIIMHSEIHLDEQEIIKTIDGLSDGIDSFFLKSLKSDYRTISGYSALINNFEKLGKILKAKNYELKLKALETIISICRDLSISVGEGEVKRITSINIATKFLTRLFSSELRFGTDLYNGYTSGSITSFKREEKDWIAFYADAGLSYKTSS